MSEVAYVLVDKDERRLTVAGLGTIEELVVTACDNPSSIDEFERSYQRLIGGDFFKWGHDPVKPGVPNEDVSDEDYLRLSIDDGIVVFDLCAKEIKCFSPGAFTTIERESGKFSSRKYSLPPEWKIKKL
jgi:hypothetical protein